MTNPVKAHLQFQHKWAVVRPKDKKWTFTQDLKNFVQTDTDQLLKNSEVEWCMCSPNFGLDINTPPFLMII